MANQTLLVITIISLTLMISLLNRTTLAAAPSPAAPPPKPTPSQPPTDIASILTQANSFNIFLRLMKTTQLINQLNSQLISIKSGGLTILAPDDGAFSELKPGFLNSLSDAKKLELLQFHVLPDIVSNSNFDTLTNPVRTLAGNKPGKVELNVITYGGTVNISTDAVNTTINGVIYMDNHLAVYRVGQVLLPSEFVATKKNITATHPPAAAPAPAPATHLAKPPIPYKVKPLSPEQPATPTQLLPSVVSAGLRIRLCETLVSLLGLVFVGLFAP